MAKKKKIADRKGTDSSERTDPAISADTTREVSGRPPARVVETSKEDMVPAGSTLGKGLDTLSEPYTNYVEAVRDVQLTAQKQYYAAQRAYLESLQNSVREAPFEDVVRKYADGVQAAWTRQDPREYVEICRQYANAVQEAQLALHRRLQDSYRTFIDEVQNTTKVAADAQRTQFEGFVAALQDAFSGAEAGTLDALTLSRIGQTVIAAAWMRASSA